MNISLLIIAVVILIALMGASRNARAKVATLRQRGLYPEEGKEQEADVRRLLQAGEKIMAIRCYRAIHRVGLKEVKAAVEQMEAGQA